MEDNKKDLSTILKKKETVKVEANIDVEIANIIEEEVKEAIEKVINEASKKYFRNISVDFSIKLK